MPHINAHLVTIDTLAVHHAAQESYSPGDRIDEALKSLVRRHIRHDFLRHHLMAYFCELLADQCMRGFRAPQALEHLFTRLLKASGHGLRELFWQLGTHAPKAQGTYRRLSDIERMLRVGRRLELHLEQLFQDKSTEEKAEINNRIERRLFGQRRAMVPKSLGNGFTWITAATPGFAMVDSRHLPIWAYEMLIKELCSAKRSSPEHGGWERALVMQRTEYVLEFFQQHNTPASARRALAQKGYTIPSNF